MAKEPPDEALIVRDAKGTYYAFPQAVLAQCRVPEDAVAGLEAQFTRDDAVAGYALPPGSPVVGHPGVYLDQLPGGHAIPGVPTVGGGMVRWTRWPV
jgi:hypothetical protein